jgi:hypothetical protein
MKFGWTEMRMNLRERFQDPAQLRASSGVAFGFAGLFFALFLAKSILRAPESGEDYVRLVFALSFFAFGVWCRVQARTCERIIALEKSLEELKRSQAERP